MANFYAKYTGVFGGGGGGSSTTKAQEAPSGTVNNANVTFTLAHTPASAAGFLLYLDGLIQYQGIDYTLSGSTITMIVAPNFGQTLWAVYDY